MLPTPDTLHLSIEKYKNRVYDPSEDTFLLLDALESDASYLNSIQPTLGLEVGVGSGCVSTFLCHSVLNNPIYMMCTDINPLALEASLETSTRNGLKIPFQVLRTDLIDSLLPRLFNKVDVLIFNPPYVVTGPEEVGSHSIEAAWAGGINGRQVIDRFLPLVHSLLSSKGVFYLVTINENQPLQILNELKSQYGLEGSVFKSRKAGIEGLSILRIHK